MPFINSLLKYTNDYFIETGTYQGDTVQAVYDSGLFKTIYSIELSPVFYENCTKRFENTNVKIFKGSSRTDLAILIKNINSPITFWLDSHWSGVPDIGVDPVTICPILEELEQIKKHPIKNHTIMIDDMRLMDGNHFPVHWQDIIKKVMEINPAYKIQMYNDEWAKGDVLVACVDHPSPICIHKYLTTCKTNSQPPGLADFLRGTVALFNFSKKYNYRFFVDNTHPAFALLESNNYVKYLLNTQEFIPGTTGMSYADIYNGLETLFQIDETFSVITNSFYTVPLQNFGPITDDCRKFMKDLLKPNDVLKKAIFDTYKSMNIDFTKGYRVIHLRVGDHALIHGGFDLDICKSLSNMITNIMSNNPYQYILLSDSSVMANEIARLTNINYWDNQKTHLGSLNNKEGVTSTLVDFFIMAGSDLILYNGSGFAEIVSVIYEQPIVRFSSLHEGHI